MTTVKGIRRVEKNLDERRALTGLVVDSSFLEQIAPITRLEFFKSPYAQKVATWCLDHYKEYKQAPGPLIEEIFRVKEKNQEIDGDEADLILQFLEGLSEDFSNQENRSTEYAAKTTERYFKKRSLELLKEDITERLSAGDVEGAEEELISFKAPTREVSNFIDPWKNQTAIIEAFTQQSEPLFTIPGALGEVWNSQFVRDSFIGILAPEKRGKTYLMMKLSMLAIKANCKVAFFAVGDMTQPQMIRRYAIMQAKKSDREKYCGKLKIPVLDCLHNQAGTCEHFGRKETWGDQYGDGNNIIKDEAKGTFKEFEQAPEWIPCAWCIRDKEFKTNYSGSSWFKIRGKVSPLTWRETIKLGEKVANSQNLRLSCHKNTSINIRGISSILKNWESSDGFVPDVILIDYADILAPEDGKIEHRHQQNATWKAMRALSQELNCLVITATQSDANSYNQKTLKESNFSEDKRKYSHVTAIATLNQLPEEKARRVLRIGQMFLREDDFDTNQTVTVLQSLATGQPIKASYFTPYIKPQKKEK